MNYSNHDTRMPRKVKRRSVNDVPSRAETQSLADALGNFMDKRGMRPPGHKAFVERIREGVKRRQARKTKPQ